MKSWYVEPVMILICMIDARQDCDCNQTLSTMAANKHPQASEGESNIAADKQQVKDHDEHMEELQKETAKKGEQGKI